MDSVPAVNAQTGTTYTLALTDTVVTCANSSAVTVTVPANGSVAFPIGKEIEVEQAGAGQVTFAGGIGVTLTSASGNLTISAQGGKVFLRKTNTNAWYLSGDLTVTSNVLYQDASVNDIVSNGSKATLAQFSVPANKLGTSKAIELIVSGDYLNNSGSTRTLTIEIAYGSTVLWADVTTNLTASTVRHPWQFRIILSAANATNAQNAQAWMAMDGTAAATTGLGDLSTLVANAGGFSAQVSGSSAEDSTSAKNLTVSVTHSASNASLSMRRNYVIAYMLGEGQKGDTGATGPQGTGASEITENPQSGTTYTLVLTDKGKVVTCTNASAITLTVPPNSSVAFTAGDVVYVCQGGAGAVTIAPGLGVTLKKPYSLITGAQDAWLALVYMGSDVWRVTGQSV